MNESNKFNNTNKGKEEVVRNANIVLLLVQGNLHGLPVSRCPSSNHDLAHFEMTLLLDFPEIIF